MLFFHFCEWLANTTWSTDLHGSEYMYPLIESVHVLTLCLFLGMAVMLDLRLLGVTMRNTSASEVVGQLEKWTKLGFVLMVISGALLFYAIPVRTCGFFTRGYIGRGRSGTAIQSRQEGPGWQLYCLWPSGRALPWRDG